MKTITGKKNISDQRKAEMREYSRLRRAKKKQERNFTPQGDEARLAQMREYSSIKRALAKAATEEQRQMHLRAKEARMQRMKEERLAISKQRAEIRRQKKNLRRREIYQRSKPEDWKDGRALRALNRPATPPNQKKAAQVRTDPKPIRISGMKQEGKVFRTLRQDLSKKVKLVIPELKLTVFIDPGKDPEAVRQKYLSRRS